MSAVAVAEADAAVAEAERAIAAASLDESGDTRVPKGGFRVDAMSMKDGEVCRGSVSQPRDGSVQSLCRHEHARTALWTTQCAPNPTCPLRVSARRRG